MGVKFLITLIGLPLAIYGLLAFAAYEKASGDRKWQETRDAFLASGESLDPAQLYAKAVPAEENFAAIPELDGINIPGEVQSNLERLRLRSTERRWPKPRRALHEPRSRTDLDTLAFYFSDTGLLEVPDTGNLAQDLLTGFEARFGKTVRSISAARNRKHAVFLPLRSTLVEPEKKLSSGGMPAIDAAYGVSRGLRLHGILAFRTGNFGAASESLSTISRVAEAAAADGKCLITHLVSTSISMGAIDPIWEGLLDQSWNSEQLLELQNSISRTDIYQLLRDTVHAELIANLDALDFIERDPQAELATVKYFAPETAWAAPLTSIYIDHNRAAILSVINDSVIAPARDKASYIDLHGASRTARAKLQDANLFKVRLAFAKLMTPGFDFLLESAAIAETQLVQAATACALERYFLKHQTYPKGLHSLVPEFIKELPRDPMDNKIMRYQKTDDNRYQLHSIGWDGLDDEGGEGDIVWSYKSQ